MDYNRLCYGCFAEKSTPVCPYCGFSPATPADYPLALPTGSILNGKYLTGKVLGQGGFGITYLGFDMTLQLKVALKEYMPTGQVGRSEDHSTVTVLSQKDADGFGAGKEKFLDEARILAKLQNAPNIVSVQNYFHENNTAYFVMEYIDGMSLKEFAASQGGRLAWPQAESLLLPIAEALANVHAQNLLHRDISPDNIFITKDGKSKLLDFGAARFVAGGGTSLSVILKHGFAPEEQYRTRGNQGPWTDIYALGATFYNALTGVLPPDAIERLHCDTLAPPSALGVSLPPAAEAGLLIALAVKAENRFHNMPAFIAALTGRGNMAATRPVPAPSVPPPLPAMGGKPGGTQYSPPAPLPPQSVGGQAALPAPSGVALPPPKKSTPTKILLIGLGGAVLLLVLVGALIFALLSGGQKSGDGNGLGGGGGGGGGGTPPPRSIHTPPTSSIVPPSSSSISSGTGSYEYTSDEIGFSITLPEGWTVDESQLGDDMVIFDTAQGSRILISYYADVYTQDFRSEIDSYINSLSLEAGGDGATLVSEEPELFLGNYTCYYFAFTCDKEAVPILFLHNYLIDSPSGCYNIVYGQSADTISSSEVVEVTETLFTLLIFELGE